MSTDARTDAEVIADLEIAVLSDDDLRAVRERFVARADGEDLFDVAYRTVDSPFGALLVAASPRRPGASRVRARRSRLRPE